MPVESLGRYRIEKELGRGAMGQVFLAYDPQIERRVAIKTIQVFSALPQGERLQARDRFLREARSAGKLLHPGIVTIFDVGESDGVPYLAMEFVEGATLDGFCRDDALLPVPVVVELVAGAADALAFAHRHGIVHRDIKPANLMRVGETSVKIMDFGLAKNPATSMTHDGTLLGTPNYMSPEQVRGDALDGRADLFSLGVVLHELLTGEKPFGGDSISSVLFRIVHEEPKEPALHLDRVAPSLGEFLQRALAKKPEDRFEDGVAFAAALRDAGAARSLGASAPAPRAASVREQELMEPPRRDRGASTPRVSAPKRSRSGLVWTLAAAGILAAAILGWLAWGGGIPSPRAQLELRVRTEPSGLPVTLNGAPLDGGVVRFEAEGPFGVLVATQGCREAKRRIEPGDAGQEIVLVLDPVRTEVTVDPGVAGAAVVLNGAPAGATPARLDLDLCIDNVIESAQEGFTTAHVAIPAGASPLDARNAAGSLKLDPLPMGRLALPVTRLPLRYFVDGKAVSRPSEGLSLPVGPHEVRATDEGRFLDLATTVHVEEGLTATASFALAPMAKLVVQTYPPNARVSLKRAASEWRSVGETPLSCEVVAGRYAMKIEAPGSGETMEREVELRSGANRPVRVSFGRPGR